MQAAHDQPGTLDLLADFCAADSLAELLSLTGLTPAELLEAIESDDARRQLDAYHRLIEIKRRLAEAKAALAATQRLAELAESPATPPETVRKAAAAILRPKHPATAPRRAAEPPTTRPTATDTNNEPIAHALERDLTPPPIRPPRLDFLTAAPRQRANRRAGEPGNPDKPGVPGVARVPGVPGGPDVPGEPAKPGGLSPPPPPPPHADPAPRPRHPPPTPAPCRPPSTA